MAGDREHLPDEQFAYIDSRGQRHLPLADSEQVRRAITRFGRMRFESWQARQRAAYRILAAAQRYGLEVDPEDDVSRATR
ncbi:MAG: hypothetical protein IRZ14_14545 [Chloroflexi bacterium]|nr:hypothetical protein [Chloroflexota bacterium]